MQYFINFFRRIFRGHINGSFTTKIKTVSKRKLTPAELDVELENFKKYLITPRPIGIDDYKNNEFISKLLEQNSEYITRALTAWLVRAEIINGDSNE